MLKSRFFALGDDGNGKLEDDGDTSDRWLQVDDAAQDGRNLTDNRGDETDQEEGNKESSPAAPGLARRHKSGEDLPVESEELPESLTARDLSDGVILVDGRSQGAGLLELLAPGQILLLHEVIEHLLLLSLLSCLGLLVDLLNVDEASSLLREGSASGHGVRDLEGK